MVDKHPISIFSIRADVVDAVQQKLARRELDKLDTDAIVRQFSHRIGVATICRWIDETVQRLAEERQKEVVDPCPANAIQASPSEPMVADSKRNLVLWTGSLKDRRSGQLINRCVQTAQEVQDDADLGISGTAHTKLRIAANEQLRKTIGTAARVANALTRAHDLDGFNTAVMEEIGKESPECCIRINLRLQELLRGSLNASKLGFDGDGGI